jgi:hypothetical protein
MPLCWAREPAAVAVGMSAPFCAAVDHPGEQLTMADEHHDVQHDFQPHAETWHGFVRGSIALILASISILVGLVSIGFGSFLPLFLGFLGIIAVHIAIAIDLRTASPGWGTSLSVLGLFTLITLINIY